MKGIVTINTDAAFHSEFKVGAFAFWIVSDMGRVIKSGSLRDKVNNATEAELKCILNAFYTLKQQKWEGIYKVILNTDSLNSIYILKEDSAKIKKYNLKYGDAIRNKFNSMKVGLPLIEFRHIKAHKTTEIAKSWVNDWCDKNAKKMLWESINNKS